MANDDLLQALGAAARERRDAVDDAELQALLQPLDEATKAKMAAQAEAALSKGKVVAFAPRRAKWKAAAVVVPLALAASLVLVLTWPRTVVPLAPYDLEVTGSVQAVRGEPAADGPLVVEAGTSLQLVLRPSQAIDGAVAANAYLWQGERSLVWPGVLEAAPTGALKLVLMASTLTGPQPGEAELVVVVGRAGEPLEPGSPNVQVFRRAVQWR